VCAVLSAFRVSWAAARSAELSDKGELAKGGWAGQLVYVNRDKDVVVAYFGTNLTADPKLERLPCRIIANTFF